MRVFLTGSSGKIGSVVKRIFGEAGHEVVSYDIAEGHDIMNATNLHKMMQGCDWVAHLAMAMGTTRLHRAVMTATTPTLQ